MKSRARGRGSEREKRDGGVGSERSVGRVWDRWIGGAVVSGALGVDGVVVVRSSFSGGRRWSTGRRERRSDSRTARRTRVASASRRRSAGRTRASRRPHRGTLSPESAIGSHFPISRSKKSLYTSSTENTGNLPSDEFYIQLLNSLRNYDEVLKLSKKAKR